MRASAAKNVIVRRSNVHDAPYKGMGSGGGGVCVGGGEGGRGGSGRRRGIAVAGHATQCRTIAPQRTCVEGVCGVVVVGRTRLVGVESPGCSCVVAHRTWPLFLPQVKVCQRSARGYC
jgi:hypothetical protein